jgi:hypothetical protein
MQDSKPRWETAVQERVSAANPLLYFVHGIWCFGYAISADRLQPSLELLLETLRHMPGQTRCLHPWRVPSPVGERPYPFRGVLECWPSAADEGFSPDYWRASPELKMFYLRKYDEDQRDEGRRSGLGVRKIDLRAPIWLTSECRITHAARLCKALELPEEMVAFHALWKGLGGRSLYLDDMTFLHRDFSCQQDTIESSTSMAVGDLESKLQDITRALVTPLYEAFDLYRFRTEDIRAEISDMLKRCAGTDGSPSDRCD